MLPCLTGPESKLLGAPGKEVTVCGIESWSTQLIVLFFPMTTVIVAGSKFRLFVWIPTPLGRLTVIPCPPPQFFVQYCGVRLRARTAPTESARTSAMTSTTAVVNFPGP